ncbi:HNH endonuclease [Chryseolinea soli]
MSLELLKNYYLHKSVENLTERYIRDQTNKTCRYCHGKFPEVTFLTKPHIIPELFGRNSVTSNFECDDCNKRFQKYESDTSSMIQHYLGLLNIKTKNGVPTFQSIKKSGENSSVLRRDEHQVNLAFGTNANDFELDEENRILTIYFRTKKFMPYSVYRTFLKMGISLLTDDELSYNNHYLKLLNSEVPLKNGMQHWIAYRYVLKLNIIQNLRLIFIRPNKL